MVAGVFKVVDGIETSKVSRVLEWLFLNGCWDGMFKVVSGMEIRGSYGFVV